MFRRIFVENLWITGARKGRYENKNVFRLPLVTMLPAIMEMPPPSPQGQKNCPKLWKTHRFNVSKWMADNSHYPTILDMLGITRILRGVLLKQKDSEKSELAQSGWATHPPPPLISSSSALYTPSQITSTQLQFCLTPLQLDFSPAQTSSKSLPN